MRQTILEFDDGAVSHSLVKVKVEDLDEWDTTHDPRVNYWHRVRPPKISNPKTTLKSRSSYIGNRVIERVSRMYLMHFIKRSTL